MNDTISPLIEKSGAFKDVLACIRGGKLPCSVFGVTQNAKPYFAQALRKNAHTQVLCITATEQGARDMAAAQGGVLFPDNDFSLRSVEAKGREEELRRVGILKNTAQAKGVVYLSVRTFLSRMLPPDRFRESCLLLQTGREYDPEELLHALARSGYERAGTVYSKGECARRGEILDIFPSDSKRPLRVTFFDNEIESIRFFDSETQKSEKKTLAEYLLPPAREVVLDEEAKDKLRYYLKEQDNRALAEKLLMAVDEYGNFDNSDTFLPVMFDPAYITDYFPDALLLFDDFEYVYAEAKRLKTEFDDACKRLERDGEAFAAQGESISAITPVLKKKESLILDMAGSRNARLKTVCEADLNLRAAPGYNGRIDMLAQAVTDRLKHGYSVVLCAGAKARSLSDALGEFDLIAPVLKEPQDGGVSVCGEYLPYGFEIPSARTIVLGANDIFGRVHKKAAGRKAARQASEEDIFSDLAPGDFVVHEVHGKGKYLGLKTLEAGGNVAEYMEIEYRGGDKLYIPTAQIDRVQKYIGSEDAPPQLSKLGGKEWENAKTKARESALKLAFDLVELYAQRFESKGHAFAEDTVWQKQFEDAFLYEETEGQLRSIEQIKKDMESPRVMDRLLLGDVGYGKTEVAMRAAMKAVTDGKQVAVLVPTTLLARQHLKTFRERFADFPVTIAGLSRFSKAKHKEVLADLRRGKIDIVIGTHRLLSNDVQFNDLGLLIVDEEQRFGVSHKEKIKLMRQSVDVLTLSATPIPRTLEMSMVGIRDLSTIDTPPAMRKQPYSYVMRYSDGLLADAVMREINRGGQVYLVCRQIREMDKLLADVRRNVPQARVAAAHGQMGEAELERVIGGFIDGEYDVLVCTTIIESGIDIPSVNTIIVYEADKFGLSQLYQLKGRVGRSDKNSYAYFTYLGDGSMKENAAKRMAAIREFTQLGSGFKIAMRDLQIRGAGNLLGPEQSGHMATVGYAMYCKLMREAVATAKGKRVEPETDTAVELNVPAYIPDRYIKNQTDKMDIYKLISKVKSISDAKAAANDIADRYGKIPKEVNNLIIAAAVKAYASAAGIASVIKKRGCIELKYGEQTQPHVKKLLKIVDLHKDRVILRPSVPPVIVYKIEKDMQLNDFLEFLKQLRLR
ncbi:transcription-repair-coupling factor [Christensenellaceae bacterium]|nr:transcription-repair-coupling factor [Christensenellaceae bacterium]BDF60516.1 transcription-repair-coupling factor [Christensenellaceae bacterium]